VLDRFIPQVCSHKSEVIDIADVKNDSINRSLEKQNQLHAFG